MSEDIIIAGAGPAGAIAAYQLAHRGLRVRLIEKKKFPRYKTCAGGLTMKAANSLPFDAGETFEFPAEGGVLSYQGKTLIKVKTDKPISYLVRREKFDNFLVQKATEAGALLSEELEVKHIEQKADGVIVHTPKGNFEAAVLIGADGVNSVIAREADMLPNRQTGIALETELHVPAAALEEQGHYATFDFGAIPYGYGWIFPKKDRLTVGVFHAKPGKAKRIRNSLKTFINNLELIQKHETIRLTGHYIPLGGGNAPLHKGRILLIGDAANLADPWLGEGLYYAIRSGLIASDVISSAFESNFFDLKAYTQTIQEQIIKQFHYAKIFASIVYNAQYPCSLAFQRSEILQQAVFSVIRGNLTFKEMLNAVGSRLPVIGWQMLRWSGATDRDYSDNSTVI